ncbi:MAG: hypothetical protein WBC53_11435 [Phycisphaerae bacterium]
MDYVIIWLINSVFLWVLLLIAMLITRKVGDISFPPLRELLWKAAMVSLVTEAVLMALVPIMWWGGPLVAFGVFALLMMKLFEMEFWQASVIALATLFVYVAAIFALHGALG